VPAAPESAREGVRIDLTGQRIRALERLAGERGTTVAALVGGAVDGILEGSA